MAQKNVILAQVVPAESPNISGFEINVRPLAESVANAINRHIFFLSIINALPPGSEIRIEMLDDGHNIDNPIGVAYEIKPKNFPRGASDARDEICRQLNLQLNPPTSSALQLAFSQPSLLSDLAYDEELAKDLSNELFDARCARFILKNESTNFESTVGTLTLTLLYPKSFLKAYGLYSKKDGLTLEEFIKSSGHAGLEADYGLEIRRLLKLTPKKKHEIN